METLLGIILAAETNALILPFPAFRKRILHRKELEAQFLPSPRRSKLALRFPHRKGVVLPPTQLSTIEQAIDAVRSYTRLEASDEVCAIYTEAQNGNSAAQFIVGVALLRMGREEIAKAWLSLSAARGFKPAKQYLKKAG